MPNDDFVIEQLLAVEFEITLEMCAPEEEREPVAVICPHGVVRNMVDRSPEWNRFIGLARFAEKVMGDKNGAMQAVTIAKLKVQFAALFGRDWHDVEFLESFAEGSVERILALIDLAARAVDFSRAEPAFLVDEKDLVLANNEEEIGANARLPVCPVDHVTR